MSDRVEVVVVPCHGVSARGQVTTLAIDEVSDQLEGVRCVNIVPLMAGMTDEVAAVRGARVVVGLAGCDHRCDVKACQDARGRGPDEAIVVGELLRAEVIERSEATDEEINQCALTVSSRLVGLLGKALAR